MPLTAKDIIKAFERAGWVQTRQKGSHVRLYNPKRPTNSVTVSVHQGKEIPTGTLRAILKVAGRSQSEFEEMRRQ